MQQTKNETTNYIKGFKDDFRLLTTKLSHNLSHFLEQILQSKSVFLTRNTILKVHHNKELKEY